MSKPEDKIYISHTCKNPACQKAFIDIDFCLDDDYSPCWKMCNNCKSKGFKHDLELRDKTLFYNNFNKQKAKYFKDRIFDDKAQQIFDMILEKRRKNNESTNMKTLMCETAEIRSYYTDDEKVKKIK